MIPIDQTLATILSMAKGDVERKKKLQAHLQVLTEQEEVCEQIVTASLEHERSPQKHWSEAISTHIVAQHKFGTLSEINAERKSHEHDQQVQRNLEHAIDNTRTAMDQLRRVQEEKAATLQALEEYHLEGWHCIIS